jgi:hypothetical protein
MKIPTILIKYKTLILLCLILLTAYSLRSFGRNWDEGGHLHPDERMLIMVADRINFPNNLNPDFFNYGSLPIYLLRGSAQIIDALFQPRIPVAGYNGMLILGRTLSSVFDVGTVALIFLAAYQLTHKKTTALFASLIYSLAFFPIQNSHFFVVDVYLAFFITALITTLIYYARTRRFLALILMGACMGAAVATKFTALVFMPGIIVSLGIIHCCSSPAKRDREPSDNTSRPSYAQGYGMAKQARSIHILRPRSFMLLFERSRELITHTIVFCVTSFAIFSICMPYAILPPSGILSHPQGGLVDAGSSDMLDSYPGIKDIVHFLDPNRSPETRFLRDVRDQTRMNSDAYVFPYTLQYVTTKPYIYHIEQISRWGLGPFIGMLTVIGTIFLLSQLFDLIKRKGIDANVFVSWILGFCIFVTYGFYFLVIGRSAVKFMRYMLPLYPILAILAGYGLSKLTHRSFVKSHTITVMMVYKAVSAILLIGTLVWSLTFINIYSERHTRIAATDWILENIPSGKTLAVEHWDDRVPIRYGEQYQYQEMTIYELPDNETKWEVLMQRLTHSDYVILASNRLYTPLPKLADCKQYKVCYPLATQYYKKLFDGSLGFKKIKEFTAYPRLGPWVIKDDDADESFTVYEHPKVIVLKRISTRQ